MFKRAKVVMLPTNKATWPNCIWLGRISKQLHLDKSYSKYIMIDPSDDSMLPQHLYFLSNEEIKEGDWIIFDSFRLERAFNWKDVTNCKKIIASTNPSLNLPLPSQSFIEKYITEYNKGNKIADVMVEYQEDYQPYFEDNKFHKDPTKFILNVNSKDNTISIRKIKDNWNREEVTQLCWQAYIHMVAKSSPSYIEGIIIPEFNKWIESNL